MPAAATINCLVVDDQQTIRSLVRSGLQELGFKTIHEAVDGEEGLRQMLTRPFGLVISDFNMPKLDGLGLLRAVRSHPIDRPAGQPRPRPRASATELPHPSPAYRRSEPEQATA